MSAPTDLDMPLRQRAPVPGSLWVVVPVKPRQLCKQRLEKRLGALRAPLSLVMFKDVLSALGSSHCVAGVVVVTRDDEVAAVARARGAKVLEETASLGMNRAIADGLAAARRHGAEELVVLPLDIPLLTGSEFDRLVAASRWHAKQAERPVMGLVPSLDRAGTNWLYLGAGCPFEPTYGPDSYSRHREQGERQGCDPVTLDSRTVSLDIDTEGDLEAFAAHCHAHPRFQDTGTWQFMESLRDGKPFPERSNALMTEDAGYAHTEL